MRRKRRKVIAAHSARTREELEAQFGRVWTVQDVAREFIITAIIDHTVVVRRKEGDQAVGTLEYQAGPPCLYFHFQQQAGYDP